MGSGYNPPNGKYEANISLELVITGLIRMLDRCPCKHLFLLAIKFSDAVIDKVRWLTETIAHHHGSRAAYRAAGLINTR
jgi:hypothetical protein